MRATENNSWFLTILFILIALIIAFMDYTKFAISMEGFDAKELLSDNILRLQKRLPLMEQRVGDINRATVLEIQGVPGIGEKTAQRVIDFREKVGFILDISSLERPFGPLRAMEFQAIGCYFTTSFHN